MSDANGSDTADTTLTINHAAPTLTLSGPAATPEGVAYTLNLSALGAGLAADPLQSWTINWGDTTPQGADLQTVSGNVTSLTHTYVRGPNDFTIRATASDNVGTYQASNTVNVVVTSVPPTLTLTGPTSVYQGEVYTLILSAAGDLAEHALTSWTINWGDNTTETYNTASPLPANWSVNSQGGYTVTHTFTQGQQAVFISARATDDAGSYDANVIVPATPAQPEELLPSLAVQVLGGPLTASGQTVTPVEGASFTATVATFTDPIPNNPVSDYTATIQWGNGDSSTGVITANGNGSFNVTGTYTYAEEGTYAVTVLISDNTGRQVTASSTANVSDPAVIATGGFQVNILEGIDPGPQTVATFTDPGGAEANSDYTAVINWEDGSTSNGTITFNQTSGQFTVTGDHTYAVPETTPIQVTIEHDSAPSVTVSDTATVENVAPTVNAPTGQSALATAALTFNLGSFTDPGLQDGPWDVQVNWGDSTNPTQFSSTNEGSLGTGTHTFAAPGTFDVTVSVTDKYGATGTNSFQVTVAPASTTTTVASSLSAAVYGQSVTLTATVGVTAPATGVPTGSVTFYDGSTILGTGSLSVVNGQDQASYTTTFLRAGSHSITAVYSGDSVFQGSTSTSLTQSVTPASLVVTTDAQSKVYGQTFTAFTGSIMGLENGDSITASFSSAGAGATASAGGYAITATLNDPGNKLANYSVTNNGNTLTITRAPLTISAANQTRVYGQANPTFTGSILGLQNGDNITAAYTTSASLTSPVGTYSIVPAVIDSTPSTLGNYSVTLVNGTLTIGQDSTTIVGSVSSSQSSFGQSVTLTASVTAAPPGSGTPTGNVDFYDATTATNLGSAALSSGVASLSTADLEPVAQTILVTYGGDGNFVGSLTTVSLTVSPSVEVLNPTASNALSLSGNAHLSIPGAVEVESNSSTALSASGNATINAGSIQVVGGYQATRNAHLTPTPITHAPAMSDPLAGLAAPTGGTSRGSVNLGGNSTLTLNPGIYSQITVSGNARLTLNPGVYILAGGGFSVSGNAIVTGSGVLLYNAGSNYPGTGGQFGAINFSGNANVTLSAASTGVYAGIVIFQSRDNSTPLSMTGCAIQTLQGLIYAPAALLTLSGNAQLNGAVLVNQLQLSENGIESLSAASSSTASAGSQLPATDCAPTVCLAAAGFNTSNEISPTSVAGFQTVLETVFPQLQAAASSAGTPPANPATNASDDFFTALGSSWDSLDEQVLGW